MKTIESLELSCVTGGFGLGDVIPSLTIRDLPASDYNMNNISQAAMLGAGPGTGVGTVVGNPVAGAAIGAGINAAREIDDQRSKLIAAGKQPRQSWPAPFPLNALGAGIGFGS